MHYQYLTVPLPDQIIVFGIGDWPKVDNSNSVEVVVSYKDDVITIGKITKQKRYEKRILKISSFVFIKYTCLTVILNFLWRAEELVIKIIQQFEVCGG